jgi:hypothetical protein
MEIATYETVIETLVKELKVERWRLKEAQKELEEMREAYLDLTSEAGNDGKL